MKRITRLTESDITRIVKRVLQEQPVTNSSFSVVGETLNLYFDKENKNFWKITTIEDVRRMKDGGILIGLSSDVDEQYTYYCTRPNELLLSSVSGGQSGYLGTNFFNEAFTKKLRDKYCGRSVGDTSVPKATFSQTGKKIDSDLA